MVTYVDSHTPLVITVILIMFQYVNILKQYVFQDFIPGFRITMRTYVDRVRDVLNDFRFRMVMSVDCPPETV